ncbi:MAG TPA: phosphatidylglycerophosphatase A [Syntrophobacteraceae bacterium]|nr:phosphatidylglycerophosphatase A [Syntrophobacteraceae bacterium]HBZ55610.1 phosphatidylglycerophosphatase A [Syntrophobacteraceae bacterium]
MDRAWATKGSSVVPASLGTALFWARLGWAGLSPFASGTVATALVGIPCAWFLSFLPMPLAMGALALLFFVACYVSSKASVLLGQEDPHEIVIDELVGFLVTMVGLPFTLQSAGVGFLAFRLFDIWKPWPVRRFDQDLHGGLGIVMDDLAAGCYAHAVVWAVLAIWR